MSFIDHFARNEQKLSWRVSIISNVCIHSSDDTAAVVTATRGGGNEKESTGEGFDAFAPPDGSTVVNFIDSRAGPRERVYSRFYARVSLCTSRVASSGCWGSVVWVAERKKKEKCARDELFSLVSRGTRGGATNSSGRKKGSKREDEGG